MFRQLIALPLLVVTASAASASDDTFCRSGLFPQEPPFALAEIAGDDRVHFLGDVEGCPWTGNDCSFDAYVIPGDTVPISKISNGYACAYYPSGTAALPAGSQPRR